MFSGLKLGRRLAALCVVLMVPCAFACGASAAALPLPADASVSASELFVNALSCPAAGDCSATGMYIDTSGEAELVFYTQTNGIWSPTEASLAGLTGATGGLEANHPYESVYPTSISCPTAGNCTAIGDYRNAADLDQSWVAAETNGVWSAPARATPPANMTPPGVLTDGSVSCGSVGNCVAVGDYEDTSSEYEPYSLAETNGVWGAGTERSLPAVPAPAAQPGTEMYSVDCTAPGNCVSDGTYKTSGGAQEGVLLTEANGTWSATTMPLTGLAVASASTHDVGIADNSGNSSDDGTLACPSAGSCVGVAQYTDVNGYSQGLLLTQSAGSWKSQTLDLSQTGIPVYAISGHQDPNASISSVACASADNCTAIGTYLTANAIRVGFVVHEVNGSWLPASSFGALPADASSVPNTWPDTVSCGGVTCVGGLLYNSTSSNLVEAGLETSSLTGQPSTSPLPLANSIITITNDDWVDASCSPSGYCAVIASYEYALSGHLYASIVMSAPGAPSVVAVPSVGAAAVQWTAPADTGGYPVSGYSLKATDLTNASGTGQTLTFGPSTLSATLTGLTPGDSYTFTVTASGLLGLGVPENSAAVTVPTPAPAGPARAAIIATLKKVLVPSGPNGRLKAIHKAHGYTFRYTALESGRLTFAWDYGYTTGKGKHKHKHTTLVGSRSVKIASAKRLSAEVKLTKAGRRLLSTHRKLKLTAHVAFTPTGGKAIKLARTFTLH
jgi:hypothetical protein